MEHEVERDLAAIEREYVRSPRNNYQVQGPLFIHECEVELKRGRRRAARRSESPRSAPLAGAAWRLR